MARIFNTIPVTLLREIVDYDPLTGQFTWKKRLMYKAPVGSRAGTLTKLGYVHLKVGGTQLGGGRAAWAYVHGEWPPAEIDHINCVKNDNRISNLRCANRSENNCNKGARKDCSSGIKGVAWHKPSQGWVAFITKNKKRRHLGTFDSSAAAKAARDAAARELHKEFAHS